MGLKESRGLGFPPSVAWGWGLKGGGSGCVLDKCSSLIPCPHGLSEVVSPLGHFCLQVTEL